VPVTVEAVTKLVVGRFITEQFVSRGIDPGTSNRRIAALQGFWTWMIKRTSVSINPGPVKAGPSYRAEMEIGPKGRSRMPS
jgi:hypothetical protein